MSIFHSLDLQTEVFRALTEAAPAHYQTENVFDAPPSGHVPYTYILIGEDRVTNRSDATAISAQHDLRVTVTTQQEGFAKGKLAAEEVCALLCTGDLTLASGTLCRLQFRGARAGAARGQDRRQIILNFRAFIDAN